MNYFVTGGTGFIGRFLVARLLERGGTVHVLTREASAHKLEALKQRSPEAAERIVGVVGDLVEPSLGLSDADLSSLRGRIDHFFHVAAIYDLAASAESQWAANVEGTRNAVACAEDLQAQRFHHVSSIAAGGLYEGTFREDMFEEAGSLSHPYLRTKHESEAVVRRECSIPWQVYRPSSVVGHSQSGEIDKIDGPYYSFKLLQKLRKAAPPWFPLIGVDAGSFNVVPVDYVVDAMDHIAHQEGHDGECFHLTNPDHYSVGEIVNIIADAGHAPRFAVRLDTKIFSFVPTGLMETIGKLPPVKRLIAAFFGSMEVPEGAGTFLNWNTRYDNRATEGALKGSGIEVPKLASYAGKLWDYWERNLDPDLFVDRSLRGNVAGKVVVVTGAGTGIGLATARRLGQAGAKVILAGRTLETLEEARGAIEESGGQAWVHSCDVSDMDACDAFIAGVLAEHGRVDILINNAGRSIRRSIELSYDRFHDFERTMQLNYFGAMRLILRLLPGMNERRSGHIVNISSMGVVGPPARFAGYVASKSALEGWTRCAEAEFCDRGIHFTNINMPLVRTPMIGPTKVYEYAPTISPEEAADMVVEAILHKPSRVTSGMGKLFQGWGVVAPKLLATAMNIAYRMFDDSHAAKGIQRPEYVEPTKEQVALAALMKGLHY
ncbi:MAG: SDR family oxidoreductase [Deltaproteobacteria bacterium]|nr:SDR family oxidoreductase [Deltaproteobacteria bacterium]MBW2417576.1 SDR family oxidoreductase [Deltaproteobacteria bacterium]